MTRVRNSWWRAHSVSFPHQLSSRWRHVSFPRSPPSSFPRSSATPFKPWISDFFSSLTPLHTSSLSNVASELFRNAATKHNGWDCTVESIRWSPYDQHHTQSHKPFLVPHHRVLLAHQRRLLGFGLFCSFSPLSLTPLHQLLICETHLFPQL